MTRELVSSLLLISADRERERRGGRRRRELRMEGRELISIVAAIFAGNLR